MPRRIIYRDRILRRHRRTAGALAAPTVPPPTGGVVDEILAPLTLTSAGQVIVSASVAATLAALTLVATAGEKTPIFARLLAGAASRTSVIAGELQALYGQLFAGATSTVALTAGTPSSVTEIFGRLLAGGRVVPNITEPPIVPAAPPVFPTVPIGFPVTITPSFATVLGTIPSGRDLRASQQNQPIWRLELNFEVLRDATQNQIPFSVLSSFSEFTDLCGLFLASVGQYGRFLFDAWWDDSREKQQIALGDGSSTKFVVTRTWGFGALQFVEPVGAVNTNESVSVYLDNVLQSPTTYSISGNIITFDSPPALSVTIAMTFSFYYLCQFDMDSAEFSEFFLNRWTAKIKIRNIIQ